MDTVSQSPLQNGDRELLGNQNTHANKSLSVSVSLSGLRKTWRLEAYVCPTLSFPLFLSLNNIYIFVYLCLDGTSNIAFSFFSYTSGDSVYVNKLHLTIILIHTYLYTQRETDTTLARIFFDRQTGPHSRSPEIAQSSVSASKKKTCYSSLRFLFLSNINSLFS